MVVFAQYAVEEGAIVPVALVVHQFVHTTADDDGMHTTRGLLCREGATEDHEVKSDEE